MNSHNHKIIDKNLRYKDKYRVESIRLPAWNYATSGGYFITICTHEKQCFFGEVVTGEMRLSKIGEIAHKYWYEIPNHFSNCQIDVFCIMPNHIHGILIINQSKDVIHQDAINRVSTRGKRGGVTGEFNPMLSKNSLSKIIRWYKGRCKFEINKIYPNFEWQGRFHDEIIRNEFALIKIRQYIVDNPTKWKSNHENPSH